MSHALGCGPGGHDGIVRAEASLSAELKVPSACNHNALMRLVPVVTPKSFCNRCDQWSGSEDADTGCSAKPYVSIVSQFHNHFNHRNQ